MLSKNSAENVYGEVVDFKLMLQLLVLVFMIPMLFLEIFSNMKSLASFLRLSRTVRDNWSLQKQLLRGHLQIKLPLEILQNSRESTCVGVSFLIKLLTEGLETY